MSTVIVRALGAAALVVVAATACGGTATSTAAPTAAPATSAAAPATTADAPTSAAAGTDSDQAAVEKTFQDYNKALLARDFTTACSLTAPSATDALIKALNAQGAQVSTCEDAFKAVYAVPAASGPLDQAAQSSQISAVSVSGDIATVTYSGEANGQRREGLTNKMQRIDGQWKLLGNDA